MHHHIHWFALLLLLSQWNTSSAQTNRYVDASVSVVDGAVTLSGEFEQLAGINARSANGHLSLQDADSEGTFNSVTPFSVEGGVVITDKPAHVAIGMRSLRDRIDISGITTTAILYGASNEKAADGDLEIEIGFYGCNEVALPVGAEPISGECNTIGQPLDDERPHVGGRVRGGSVLLEDGSITLLGTFETLTAIEAVSKENLLSLQAITHPGIPGGLTAPFPQGSEVYQNRPGNVTIGVLGHQKGINIEGTTRTSIV